jgi:hypothetical protein
MAVDQLNGSISVVQVQQLWFLRAALSSAPAFLSELCSSLQHADINVHLTSSTLYFLSKQLSLTLSQ